MENQLKHYSDKLAYETDTWDLRVALDGGDHVVVIDARSPETYARGHIPGAINLPHRTMGEETTAGIGCNASTKGALNMARLGFRVKELIGGLDWWRRDGHPVEENVSGVAVGGACG